MLYFAGETSEAHDDDGLTALREDDLDDAFALEADRKTDKKFMSIILTNLTINFEAWRAELPQEEEKVGEGEKKALEDGETEEEKEGDMANEERVSVLFNTRRYYLIMHKNEIFDLFDLELLFWEGYLLTCYSVGKL